MTNLEIDNLWSAKARAVPPADRVKSIQKAIVTGLRPVRPLSHAGNYLLALLGIVAVISLVGAFLIGGRGWHTLSDLQRSLIFAPLCGITLLLAYSLVRQMTPASRFSRGTAILGSAVFLLLLVLMLLIFRPTPETSFIQNGLACFRTGMLFAVPTALLLAVVLRRGAGLTPVLTGATTGALAGLAGLAVLEIHCPILDVYHIVVWHVSVVLVCAITGYFLGGVTFSRRLPK